MPPAPRDLASVRAGLAFTRAARRRARDLRLSDYAAFGSRHAWLVLGLHHDLSQRYPVHPLLGAFSAQAELALSGLWEDEPAVVASVLVRRTAHRRGDLLVQLTVLACGPRALEKTARWRRSGPRAVTPGPSRPAEALHVADLLRVAPGGSVRPGDAVAAAESELIHVRPLRPGTLHVDLEGPLQLLAFLAHTQA